MQFPNETQAALLFDRPVGGLEDMVRSFVRMEEMRSGTRFNVPEAKPGVFYRLYGADELMITFEYLDQPANVDVFQQTLASTVTGILCPDKALLNAARRAMRSVRTDLVASRGAVASQGLGYNRVLNSFIEEDWSLDRAMERSPSLVRAVDRLSALQNAN